MAAPSTASNGSLTPFGRLLKKSLAERDLFAVKLAKHLNITSKNLNDMMCGRVYPAAHRVDKICKFLNLDKAETISLHRAAARDCGWRLD